MQPDAGSACATRPFWPLALPVLLTVPFGETRPLVHQRDPVRELPPRVLLLPPAADVTGITTLLPSSTVGLVPCSVLATAHPCPAEGPQLHPDPTQPHARPQAGTAQRWG